MAGRTKEHRIAGGLAGGSVGSSVSGSEVGLDFDNATDAQARTRSTNQHLPEYRTGHLARIAGKE